MFRPLEAAARVDAGGILAHWGLTEGLRRLLFMELSGGDDN